ncbi:MAG TPA: HAD family phosphatase [Candidatus Saccharimonadales bacterium]|nr:HAD family phosphatase [Candidatus Saccharimonadales bacterium]
MNLNTLFTTKKRTLGFWFIALLSTFGLDAAKKPTSLKIVPATYSQCKSVIFDLGGVLFTTSSGAKFNAVVPTMFANPSLFFAMMGLNVKQELFKILDKVPAKTTEPMYNEGKKLPQIMVDWMTGRPSSEIRLQVLREIRRSNHSDSVKNLFRSITRLMFNPKTFANSQKPIKPMVDLAKKLKKNGYKLYVLSNWDEESFRLLKKQNTEIFNLFDGIMISGEEKLGKPNPEIYKRLLEKYNLDCRECTFIDDESNNTQAAQRFGIASIVCQDTPAVCKELINLGVMALS